MLLSLENVTFGYTNAPVLEDVSFTLHENERVGLVGGNGEGKTTLIKLMLGELSPDSGSVAVKNGIRIGYLEQDGSQIAGSTVYSAMLEVFARDFELINAMRETETKMADATEQELKILSAKYESLTKQVQARDSYHAEVKIKTVLGGMGFLNRLEQEVSTLSGGEKTKLKFCRLLLEEPDLLILDEPTNHLDVKTLFWLEDYLSSYKGTLFVVSHDRYFLDRLTTRTLEIDRGKATAFKGNYTKYKILKEAQLSEEWKQYERTCEEITRLQQYVNRNIVRATTAKSAQSRVKKIEKLGKPECPAPPPHPPRFRFEYNELPYENLLTVEKFDLVAGGKPLIKDAEFSLTRGDKCAIIGDNGAGKTTLLKYLVTPNQPNVKFAKFIKIGYYDQEQAALRGETNVLETFRSKFFLLSQTDARKMLAQAGIFADDMEKPTKQLSGGERAKLALALLQAKQGNTLILDEPTNHLDLLARESLERALREFDGTMLFVSHDRRFIEAVAKKIIVIENGKLSMFDGGYAEYLESKKNALPPPAAETPKKEERTESGYRSKEERAKEAKRRTRVKEIETRLAELEQEEERLNGALAEHASDYAKVSEISQALEALHAESEALYGEYGELI